jgi:DNA modification methylase
VTRLVLGEALEELRKFEAGSIDALVTDPPAGISFMGKEWDRPDDFPLRDRGERLTGSGNPTEARGFARGVSWDRGAGPAFVERLAPIFAECLRVLKPGAHAIVWALPRTSHWTAVALEVAGFEIRDVITHHFASGFPKSLDVSKAIDKARDPELERHAAVARFVVEAMERAGLDREAINRHFGFSTAGSGGCQQWTTTRTDRVIKPRVPTLEQWAALRVLVGFGPEMDAEVAALNGAKGEPGEAWNERPITGEHETQPPGFNGERFRSTDKLRRDEPTLEAAKRWKGWGTALKPATEFWILARSPLSEKNIAANVLEHGTGGLNVDGCRIPTGDGAPAWNYPDGPKGNVEGRILDGLGRREGTPLTAPSAGRFPSNLVLSHGEGCGEECAEGCPVAELELQSEAEAGAARFFYVAKPPTSEREIGLEGVEPRRVARLNAKGDEPEGPVDPVSDRFTTRARNVHPTVKPVELMRYLCRLVTPPGGKILDCFMGSGTTGIAALREGFDFLGIEREQEYFKIAERRIVGDCPLFNRPEIAEGGRAT